MKRQIIYFLLLAFNFTSVYSQKSSIVNDLYNLPDVVFKETTAPNASVKTFELQIYQPIDHEHPEKGHFYQRVFLTHKGFDKPMVMYISGYNQNGIYYDELSKILDANQLSIEHRYFGTSLPDSIDYQYLNLEQATADLHRINQLLKQIYHGKWASTGISKGGATTIFYKYFYPDDVDAAVPYVAPIDRAYEDERIYSFLDNVGTKATRDKIFEFQIRLFKNRDKIMPLLKAYAQGAGLTFSYLTFDQAFEYTILEYPFAFWQNGSSSEDIPSNRASIEDCFFYLNKVAGFRAFSDQDIDAFLPHYYQSATQMGYYGYRTEPFKKYIKALPLYPHPNAAIVPQHIPTPFDASLLKKINAWLPVHGNKLMYVYGGDDTWTATAVPYSDKIDAVWFILKGKNHRTARYTQMSSAEKAIYIATLEKWLGLKVQNPDLK